MKPKDRRDRLFKTSRPNIREMSLVDENGYTKDMGILWGAYKLDSSGDLSQEEFADFIMNNVEPYSKKWLIEDKNAQFGSGYGPVGMMCANYDGWEISPTFEKFEWATSRNILRSVVSFLQMMRYDKDVGIVVVDTLFENKGFFNHVTKYGVLKYASKIPSGREDGDKYTFYIKGRK